MFRRLALLTLCLASLAPSAMANLKVVTSTTDLARAAKEVGGGLVVPSVRAVANDAYHRRGPLSSLRGGVGGGMGVVADNADLLARL